jgi:hypothetical protein
MPEDAGRSLAQVSLTATNPAVKVTALQHSFHDVNSLGLARRGSDLGRE